MGSNKSKPEPPSICTDYYVREVRKVDSELSHRDRKLFNYARMKLAEEDLTDAEITVAFQDRDEVVLRCTNNPPGKVNIELDIFDKPRLVWKKRGFWRAAKRIFFACLPILKFALKTLVTTLVAIVAPQILPIAGPVLKALPWI